MESEHLSSSAVVLHAAKVMALIVINEGIHRICISKANGIHAINLHFKTFISVIERE